ncbi:MAG: MBL fold metallo-hydrolase [Armatimonadetes bacterium]|nr:MBL fold metallo-hydrolase [Armatimonadota bacterium]
MPSIAVYELHTIETGRFRLDGGAMFGVVPKPLWERKTQADERNRIPLAMRCLLLAGNERVILIDNGIGDKFDAKFADIYAVDHTHSELHRSLAAAGFSAAEITDVILTHLHFDHCGGSTRRDDGRVVPALPNARYHVQRTHWEWAAIPNAREKASFIGANFEPLERSGQLRFVDGECELFPGVQIMVVNGHTRGMQLVKVSGAQETLVFVADLIPTIAHVPPAWIMGYDVEPLVTLSEKQAFLSEALKNGWRLFFEHDPNVEIASLEETSMGIRACGPRPLASF